MNALVMILLLAAPFALLGAVVAALIVVIGRSTAAGQRR